MGLFSCWHLCDYHFLFFTGIFKLRNHTILVKASYTEKYWQPNAKLRNTKFPFYLNHPLVLIENQKKISQANHYILQPTDDWKCFKNSTWQLFACLPNNTNIKLCFMPLFYLDSIYPAFLCVYARFYHFFLSHSDTSDIFWLRAFK